MTDDTAIPQELDLQRDQVNPHFMDHMLATAARRDVQASEDILNGNGVKLLAKGTRISAATRERLLAHKLAKPLEQCVQIIDGVMPQSLEPVAENLLEQHPLLRSVCKHER
ncbi:MAG TPA: hypothetical protein VGE47_12045, partial [Burkholderiaceae bacterium]